MAGMLSQFSDIQRTDVYRFTTLEIICEAHNVTAAPPESESHARLLFRLPHRLIDAVADFNRRHSAACVQKMSAIPAAECVDPWDSAGEQRLGQEVLATLRSITRLAIEGWKILPRTATILADIAANELRQRICEEYETGRDAHLQALASLSLITASTATSATRSKSQQRRRSNRKSPVDEMLGLLEKNKLRELKKSSAGETQLYEELVAQLYGLSSEDLKPLVNKQLESRSIEPVSAKTISRSKKYKSWRTHRRPLPTPAAVGSAVNEVAGAELRANNLVESSSRKFRSSGGRRSALDRAADEFAKSRGDSLPAAD